MHSLESHGICEADPAPLTTEMQLVMDNIKKANRPALHSLSPEKAKLQYAAAADILESPSPSMASEETYQVSGLDGYRIILKVWRPRKVRPLTKHKSATLAPALVYFHGGGFTIGSVQTHAVLCKEIAARAELIVISVEYRLAPEFIFPTAHNDAWSACEWIFKNTIALRVCADHIFIGGDSAGGTLSLYCAQQAALNGFKFKGQTLFYPGCSATQDMGSHSAYASGYLLEQKSIEYFYGLYHNGNNKSTQYDWRFSALQSPHLKLMPPTWIGLAQCDPLRDEGLELMRTLDAQGTQAICRVYKGVVHGFIKMGRFIPEAKECIQDACNFLVQLI